MESATDIWVAPKQTLQPGFAQGLPGVHVQNTSARRAPKAINDFIRKHTHGMIQHVVDRVDDTGIVLTTVTYFHGMWMYPFDKRETKLAPFHQSENHSIDVEMMSMLHDFRYAHSTSGQIVQLDYQGNDGLVLTVFLPKPGINVDTWLASADGTSWKALLAKMDFRPGSLKLPRLHSSFQASISQPLQELGMHRPFGQDAQFSGIVKDEQLKIGDVVHASAFDMDELSTEASAITSEPVPSGAGAPMEAPPPPFSMVVDRPYFITVGDLSNEHILFAGVVHHP